MGRLGLALIPPYLSLQGSRFLLRSASPGRRGGAGAQQGEGRVGGGAGVEMRLGKDWWGSSGWEEESERSHHGRGRPGCPMMFPPLLLPSVSNMAESRHGELCCAGEADGEERDESFEGRISRVQTLSKLSSTVPTFPPASLSGHRGKCAGKAMNNFHLPSRKSEAPIGPRICPRLQGSEELSWDLTPRCSDWLQGGSLTSCAPVQLYGLLSLTSNFGFSRTSATTTFVFSFPGTPRHCLPVERTHSAPCAAATGYKGRGGGGGLDGSGKRTQDGQPLWWQWASRGGGTGVLSARVQKGWGKRQGDVRVWATEPD